MEKLTFENITIPESLDSIVDDLLDRLPVKKRWFLRRGIEALASFAGLIFILSILIYSNDTFADMAMDIPGLKLIAEWIHQDEGVNHAKDNGYPVLGPFVYQDGEYMLVLDNILIDEKRINFTNVLSGPSFDEKSEKDSEPVHFSVRNQMVYYEYVVSLSESGNGIAISGKNFEGNAHSTSILLSGPYGGYIRALLDAGEPLPLKVDIHRQTADRLETIYTMENIEVPLDREDVLLSREYELDESLVTPHGVIRFETLEITPTVMELHCSIEFNGVDDLGLSEYRIIDSDGTDYSSPRKYTFGTDKSVRAIQIMPSFYFDEPESLTVMYDSYHYTLQGKPYTLDLNGEFPKEYDYYGYAFIVDEVRRLGNNKLSVEFHVEDGTGFKIQSLKLDGRESHVQDFMDNKSTVYFVEEEKKDAYTMTLVHPQIIVEEKGEVELQLR
jgi:hypothetical protein